MATHLTTWKKPSLCHGKRARFDKTKIKGLSPCTVALRMHKLKAKRTHAEVERKNTRVREDSTINVTCSTPVRVWN